jgi:hypothetical protein
MHTRKIILGGFLLAGACWLLGRRIAGPAPAVLAATIPCFLVLCLAGALIMGVREQSRLFHQG